MRLIKMFGLAAVAAVAAMAFLGASSASATSTALCNTHEDPCLEENQTKSITMNLVGIGLLLNSTADVLCLSGSASANVLGLASPQSIHATELSFTKCGTNAAHNNCTVTTVELPLLELLKTALNLGTLSALSGAGEGIAGTKCTILGFIKINCDYKGGGLSFTVEGAGHSEGAGNGMLTSNNTPLNLNQSLEGGGLCPETSSIDGLLEPSSPVYITS